MAFARSDPARLYRLADSSAMASSAIGGTVMSGGAPLVDSVDGNRSVLRKDGKCRHRLPAASAISAGRPGASGVAEGGSHGEDGARDQPEARHDRRVQAA